MDYFIFDTVEDCNTVAQQLIQDDEYDFITLYNGNYDNRMHKYGPEGEKSLAALQENCETFAAIQAAITEHWSGKHNTLLGFCPDHGCHAIDGGYGSHGLDMIEDMKIVHMYARIA
jgi:predicted AlkP superfamily pyrophosphatase or phosphodiesterase